MAAERYTSIGERITWATGFQLSVDKHVLGCLSTFANFKTGQRADMKLDTLARRAALSRSTVLRALQRLEDDGWIVGRRHHRRPTVYNICLDHLPTHWLPVKVVPSLSVTGDTQESGLRVTGDTQEAVLSVTGDTPSPVRTDPLTYVPSRARASPPEQLAFGPMDAAPDVWPAVLRRIEPQLTRWLFHQWWADSVLVEDRGDTLVVRMKNGRTDHEQAAEWVERRDAALLQNALAAVGRPGVAVQFAFAVRTEPLRRQA